MHGSPSLPRTFIGPYRQDHFEQLLWESLVQPSLKLFINNARCDSIEPTYLKPLTLLEL